MKKGMEIDALTVLGEMLPHEGMNGRAASGIAAICRWLSQLEPLDRQTMPVYSQVNVVELTACCGGGQSS